MTFDCSNRLFVKGNVMNNDKDFLKNLICELVEKCNDIELLDLIVLLLKKRINKKGIDHKSNAFFKIQG